MKQVFSRAAVKKLLKQEGAKNVSEEAISELLKSIDNHARQLGRKAAKSAMLDGRKTIRKEDFEN